MQIFPNCDMSLNHSNFLVANIPPNILLPLVSNNGVCLRSSYNKYNR